MNDRADCDYKKLVEYKRNGLVEQVHCGIIIHMNREKILNKVCEDNNYPFYYRPCMKPLQAAILVDLNLHKKYNFTLEDIAVFCASHTGDVIHQQKILSVLEKIESSEDDLLCPPIQPLSKEEQKRLVINNLPVMKIHNNCSGKHSLMLAICKHKNFNINNYKDYKHPLTEIIINKVSELCEISNGGYIISKEGCGLPVIASSLENLGKGYLNLFLNPKYQVFKQAFINYPYLIGGKERLDSEIINANKNLIAKVGAGGLCVVVNLKKEECVVVKVADSNMEARSFTVITVLKQLKWLEEEDISSSPLNNIYKREIISQDNEVLGILSPCFKVY